MMQQWTKALLWGSHLIWSNHHHQFIMHKAAQSKYSKHKGDAHSRIWYQNLHKIPA